MTYAPEAAARANALATRLESFGFFVRATPSPARLGRAERRSFVDAIAKAKSVLVLWSADAPAALRAIARLAKRAGKLVLAKLDTARLPLRAPFADVRTESPRALAALKTAISGDHVMSQASSAIPRSNRIEGIGVALLCALLTASAIYFVDAPFAARVNAAASSAMALINQVKG